MRFDRVKKLFQNDFELFKKTNMLLLGVGGVGSVALDCLYRTGFKNITIVDSDCFEITNLNRQLNSETGIGKPKVQHLASLYDGIKPICANINNEWIDNFDCDRFDLILDAIDDIPSKVHLIKKFHKKLISSGGSAKRIDPTLVEYKDIWETREDPFVRKIRYELKKVNFYKKFKIIFSSEKPQCTELGSFMGVTGTFGLTMASLAIQKILQQHKQTPK